MFSLPPFMNPANSGQEFETEVTIGGSQTSYLEVKKGGTVGARVDPALSLPSSAATVARTLPLSEYGEHSIGITVAASNDALDAALLSYVESFALRSLSYITGMSAEAPNGRLTLKLSQSAASTQTPNSLAAAIKAGLLFHFGKLEDLDVSVELDQAVLARSAPAALADRARRVLDAKSVSEESSPEFYFCTGCSTFALGHVCIITPERVPMCGRNWVQIKAGAYLMDDDLSRSFKRRNQENPSSTGLVPKGRCIDPIAGEYEGVNEIAQRESGGKVNRVFLHSLFGHPHSCCSCFLYLVFFMPEHGGFGIMNRNWEGKSPDGRTWADLANEAAGRQREGIVGVNLPYIRSPRFLQADGGLSRVAWTPTLAEDFVVADSK